MKNPFFILFITILLLCYSETMGQELLVKNYDAQRNLVKIDTFLLGDFVIIKHAKKGKNPHHFQGKITGLFKKRGVIRVFDYARSTRVMPIVGKKEKIAEQEVYTQDPDFWNDPKKAEQILNGKVRMLLINEVGHGQQNA